MLKINNTLCLDRFNEETSNFLKTVYHDILSTANEFGISRTDKINRIRDLLMRSYEKDDNSRCITYRCTEKGLEILQKVPGCLILLFKVK